MRKTKQRHIVPLDKRAHILDAAITVFAKKGFSGSTISDVAKKAGVACGTVYLYFKNKDDLLIQCMHEMIDSKLKGIKNEISHFEKANERLYQFFIKHIELFTQNPDVARFMLVEVRQSEEFYTRYPTYNPLNEYISYVQTLIRDAINEGTHRDVDVTALSYMIIGAMDLTLTQWLIGNKDLDLIHITDKIRDILRHGILA